MIIQVARNQLDVPYLKDTRIPFVALDCVGLLSVSYGSVYPIALDVPMQGLCGGFTDDRLLKHLETYGFQEKQLKDGQPGDIIVWNYHDTPHHTGMLTEYNRVWWVIHSSSKYNKVAEHPLGGEWLHRYHSLWGLTG